jgi:hypothetical protein
LEFGGIEKRKERVKMVYMAESVPFQIWLMLPIDTKLLFADTSLQG